MSTKFLASLNQAQSQAVTYDPTAALQILAGPGSGKTRVLTCRVAYLVQHHEYAPEDICAVTFTNKAANEMKERLKKLIGNEKTEKLVMGTFHAICARYLRKYGRLVELPNNYTICDTDECRKIVDRIIKSPSLIVRCRSFDLKDSVVVNAISKAKAKGQTAEMVRMEHGKEDDKLHQLLADVFEEYTRMLKESNSVDFDDLLVLGVKLLRKAPHVVSNIRHILVDEFQDTNTIQYELMIRFAEAHSAVSTVGDPDQSIYGWRSAEIENLHRMRRDFPGTKQVVLDENYRSTGSILAASMAIVSEDKNRIAKGLRTSHPKGPTPVLRSFTSEHDEASFIATEIKRLVAYTGGGLKWSDFVILLRYNAMSRSLESALQKERIPNRILGGHKFFERLEVKDILAYLQLIDNPNFVPAFVRVINVPKRSIGEKSTAELLKRSQLMGISPLEVVQRIYEGKIPDILPSVKNKLAAFVKPIIELRQYAASGCSVTELIRAVCEAIKYQDHLKKTQPEWESRWENVEELINFATEVELDIAKNGAPDLFDFGSQPTEKKGEKRIIYATDSDDEDEVVSTQDEEPSAEAEAQETPLRLFLQASMLSTDSEVNEDEKAKEKVTISTCHAAKGLEWPVVMVPGVEDGTFPFYRTDDKEEERRLLYVACTRAQAFLYLTYSKSRMAGGENRPKELSPFVSAIIKKNKSLFVSHLQTLSEANRSLVHKVIGRSPVEEETVKWMVAEHDRIYSGVNSPSLSQQFSQGFGASQSSQPAYQGPTPTFSTARTMISPSQPTPSSSFATARTIANATQAPAPIAAPTYAPPPAPYQPQYHYAPYQIQYGSFPMPYPAPCPQLASAPVPNQPYVPYIAPDLTPSTFNAPPMALGTSTNSYPGRNIYNAAQTSSAPAALPKSQTQPPQIAPAETENTPTPTPNAVAVGSSESKKRLGMGRAAGSSYRAAKKRKT